MAHIRERRRSDGEMSYERFMELVNGFRQQWPPGWIRGQGFVEDIRPAEEMLEPFALKHISLLTGVQGDTKAKYRRLVEQNMSPWFKWVEAWENQDLDAPREGGGGRCGPEGSGGPQRPFVGVRPRGLLLRAVPESWQAVGKGKRLTVS